MGQKSGTVTELGRYLGVLGDFPLIMSSISGLFPVSPLHWGASVWHPQRWRGPSDMGGGRSFHPQTGISSGAGLGSWQLCHHCPGGFNSPARGVWSVGIHLTRPAPGVHFPRKFSTGDKPLASSLRQAYRVCVWGPYFKSGGIIWNRDTDVSNAL